MSAKVNENGEITLPRVLLEAAGIHAGDSVTLRPWPDGGIIVQKARENVAEDAYRLMLEDMGRRKPFKGFTTKELMALTRGED
jgi:bifunctional DNA-binding transcriptional regulator/antitoxin component of YhaV-PrlF toxin-antitoxin module